MSKPIITKTRAEEWLLAVRELLAWYQKGNNKLEYDCPLCNLSESPNCQDCLWLIFEGRDCDSVGQEYDDKYICQLRRERKQPWTRNAIKRLKRWEKRLLAIIEAK